MQTNIHSTMSNSLIVIGLGLCILWQDIGRPSTTAQRKWVLHPNVQQVYARTTTRYTRRQLGKSEALTVSLSHSGVIHLHSIALLLPPLLDDWKWVLSLHTGVQSTQNESNNLREGDNVGPGHGYPVRGDRLFAYDLIVGYCQFARASQHDH